MMTGPDHDQVPRLLEFREQHPNVIIAFGYPEPHGETVITRYELKALLDKLGELLG